MTDPVRETVKVMAVVPESPSVAHAGAMVMPGLSSSLIMMMVARSERPPSGVWPSQVRTIPYLPAVFRSVPVVSGSSSMVTEPLSPNAESSTVSSSITVLVAFRPKTIWVGSDAVT